MSTPVEHARRDQGTQLSGSAIETLQLMFGNEIQQLDGIQPGSLRDYEQSASRQELHELLNRRVKSQRRVDTDPPTPGASLIDIPFESQPQVQHAPVADHHSFRPASRPGSVDDIREIPRVSSKNNGFEIACVIGGDFRPTTVQTDHLGKTGR